MFGQVFITGAWKIVSELYEYLIGILTGRVPSITRYDFSEMLLVAFMGASQHSKESRRGWKHQSTKKRINIHFHNNLQMCYIVCKIYENTLQLGLIGYVIILKPEDLFFHIFLRQLWLKYCTQAQYLELNILAVVVFVQSAKWLLFKSII